MTQSDAPLPEFPAADFYTCSKDAERLFYTTVEEAVIERFEHFGDGEIEQLSEGCTVYCHVRLKPPTIDAEDAVDWLLEHLEESVLEEYLDREAGDGECWDTDACKELRPKLESLVQRMVAGMRVWSCKQVAKVELTPQQAEEILRHAAPDLFKQAGTT